jgi:hypothetical protein
MFYETFVRLAVAVQNEEAISCQLCVDDTAHYLHTLCSPSRTNNTETYAEQDENISGLEIYGT